MLISPQRLDHQIYGRGGACSSRLLFRLNRLSLRVAEDVDPYGVLLIPHCVILSAGETRGALSRAIMSEGLPFCERQGSCETVFARPLNISNIMFGFSLALIHRRFRSLPRAFFSLNTVEKSSTSCRIFVLLLAICISSALRSE